MLTDDGKQVVDAFEEKENNEYEAFIAELVSAIKEKNTRESYLLKEEFSKKRELKEHNQTRQKIEAISSPEIWLKTLHIILNCEKIGILEALDDDTFERFRVAAALSFLAGKKDLEKYGVEDFETGLHFDNATASRMILFYAYHQLDLQRARGNDIKRVVFQSVGGCSTCQELNSKTYNIDDAPEIPHKDCNHKKGCRCYYESV
ncbi:MAG: hypothetical protein HQ517_11315 [SAR324 cluster bacterium]|nr:hypothetical protein [SAR324 cluster bacterium]